MTEKKNRNCICNVGGKKSNVFEKFLKTQINTRSIPLVQKLHPKSCFLVLGFWNSVNILIAFSPLYFFFFFLNADRGSLQFYNNLLPLKRLPLLKGMLSKPAQVPADLNKSTQLSDSKIKALLQASLCREERKDYHRKQCIYGLIRSLCFCKKLSTEHLKALTIPVFLTTECVLTVFLPCQRAGVKNRFPESLMPTLHTYT